MSIRKPNGRNTTESIKNIAPGDLLRMRRADDYLYVTTAGVVRMAAKIWAQQNDEPLGAFADWFQVLSDTAPVTVHGYNGHGVWDVRSI